MSSQVAQFFLGCAEQVYTVYTHFFLLVLTPVLDLKFHGVLILDLSNKLLIVQGGVPDVFVVQAAGHAGGGRAPQDGGAERLPQSAGLPQPLPQHGYMATSAARVHKSLR